MSDQQTPLFVNVITKPVYYQRHCRRFLWPDLFMFWTICACVWCKYLFKCFFFMLYKVLLTTNHQTRTATLDNFAKLSFFFLNHQCKCENIWTFLLSIISAHGNYGMVKVRDRLWLEFIMWCDNVYVCASLLHAPPPPHPYFPPL